MSLPKDGLTASQPPTLGGWPELDELLFAADPRCRRIPTPPEPPPSMTAARDPLGQAVDEIIDYLADSARIDRHDAHEAVRTGRVLAIASNPRRAFRQMLLIIGAAFLAQAALLFLFYRLTDR